MKMNFKRLSQFLPVWVVLMLASCSPNIQADDKKFILNLKSFLKQQGDYVHVAEVHPSDWVSVCFNPIGSYSNIQGLFVEGVGFKSQNRKIKGDKNTYADDDVWGIYFLYPNNEVEYFRIPRQEIYSGIIEGSDDLCAERSQAYLKVVGDFNHRNFTNTQSNVVGTYIEISLIEGNVGSGDTPAKNNNQTDKET